MFFIRVLVYVPLGFLLACIGWSFHFSLKIMRLEKNLKIAENLCRTLNNIIENDDMQDIQNATFQFKIGKKRFYYSDVKSYLKDIFNRVEQVKQTYEDMSPFERLILKDDDDLVNVLKKQENLIIELNDLVDRLEM